METVDANVGFSTDSFNFLRQKVDEYVNSNKTLSVCLMNDEMAIKNFYDRNMIKKDLLAVLIWVLMM